MYNPEYDGEFVPIEFKRGWLPFDKMQDLYGGTTKEIFNKIVREYMEDNQSATGNPSHPGFYPIMFFFKPLEKKVEFLTIVNVPKAADIALPNIMRGALDEYVAKNQVERITVIMPAKINMEEFMKINSEAAQEAFGKMVNLLGATSGELAILVSQDVDDDESVSTAMVWSDKLDKYLGLDSDAETDHYMPVIDPRFQNLFSKMSSLDLGGEMIGGQKFNVERDPSDISVDELYREINRLSQTENKNKNTDE